MLTSNGFSPVCVLICRRKRFDLLNDQLQWSHLNFLITLPLVCTFFDFMAYLYCFFNTESNWQQNQIINIHNIGKKIFCVLLFCVLWYAFYVLIQ